jgi:DNA-binding NarL/FixJ family response regulator
MTLAWPPTSTCAGSTPSPRGTPQGPVPDTGPGPGTRPARVLLCDSQAIARIGLRSILDRQAGVEVVGEAATGPQAVSLAERLRPELVLLDMQLPVANAIEVTRRIRELPRGTSRAPAVLLLVAEPSDEALDGLRAGARGVLVRDCDAAELAYAIRVVLDGGGFLSPPVVRTLLDRLSGQAAAAPGSRALAALTPREREVLGLLADGMSNEEIGRRLFVGEPTVKYHVSHLLQKLNLRDRLQAAVFAYRHGLKGWI